MILSYVGLILLIYLFEYKYIWKKLKKSRSIHNYHDAMTGNPNAA